MLRILTLVTEIFQDGTDLEGELAPKCQHHVYLQEDVEQ